MIPQETQRSLSLTTGTHFLALPLPFPASDILALAFGVARARFLADSSSICALTGVSVNILVLPFLAERLPLLAAAFG